MQYLKLIIPIGVLLVCFAGANAEAQTRIDREVFINYAAKLNDLTRDELCTTMNIYFEARDQPAKGQAAVAWVAKNRSDATGRTICQTVWTPSWFTWTKAPYPIEEERAWLKAKGIAVKVLRGRWADVTAGATHYHTEDVNPKWSAAGYNKRKIGAHIFMRLEGEF